MWQSIKCFFGYHAELVDMPKWWNGYAKPVICRACNKFMLVADNKEGE